MDLSETVLLAIIVGWFTTMESDLDLKTKFTAFNPSPPMAGDCDCSAQDSRQALVV